MRSEIRREIRAEQQHQSPTQQLHQEINQNASYGRNTDIQQRDLIYREKQDIWKLAKSKFGTQASILLNGRSNYTAWRDSMLMDAYMIEAKDILDETKPPNGSNEIDIARWETKNEILHTRILQSTARHVQQTISWKGSTLASELWARITSTYGLSMAEERLMTVKALLDINPQGNYPVMVQDFQRIAAKIKEIKLSLDDVIHDIFICSLGQWQQNFVRTKLDEFYSCGRGPIKNLDIDTFADQLVAQSLSYNNKYISQEPQEFKLEPRYQIILTETKDFSRTKRDGQDQKPARTKTLCQACGKGYHKPDDCWTLHPEKAPKCHANHASGTSNNNKNQQPTGQELVLWNHLQANLIAIVPAKEPENDEEPQWLLDTAAAFHISNKHHIFINLRTYTAYINDAGGRTHQIIGIGTALVYGVEIPDIRYAPTTTADLLSFSQLDDQDFDVSIQGTVNKKHFRIISPTGASLDAFKEQNTRLYQIKPVAYAIQPILHAKDTQKETNDIIPTATMEEWYQHLSHVHLQAILKMAQQKIIKIKGPKTLAFCDIC